MRVGRLHFRYATRERAHALARFDAASCYAGLRRLASALDGQPWMVVSGLVEPLFRGRFARAHSDIDIAVPVESLGAVAAAARRRGFVVTTRVLRTHASRREDLEAHLRVEPSLLAWRRRHLRLWRLDDDGELDESRFPAYVDVFPYALCPRWMHILDSGQRLPLRLPLSRDVALPGGTTVPVEDPSYVEALQAARRVARGLHVAPGADGRARLGP